VIYGEGHYRTKEEKNKKNHKDHERSLHPLRKKRGTKVKLDGGIQVWAVRVIVLGPWKK